MRARLFLSAVYIAAPLILFSQDETGIPNLQPSGTYWGIGYYTSGSIGLSNGFVNEGAVQPGYGGTIEIMNKTSRSTAAVLMIGKNIISSHNEGEHFEAVEFSLGPRLYFNAKDFGEFTVGGIMVTRHLNNITIDFNHYDGYTSEPEFDFAVSGSLGKEISLNKNSSIIFKGRFISSINIHDDMFTYFSLTAGMVFNSKKIKEEKPGGGKTGLGFTFLAGQNNPDFLSKGNYIWGSNYGFGISYRLFPKIDISLEYGINKLVTENVSWRNYEETCRSYSFNGRFFLNNSPFTSFIEFGGGIYDHSLYASSLGISAEVYDEHEYNPGLSYGTGMLLRLKNYLDLIVKGNLNFLLSGKYNYSPSYFTLQGGFKVNF